MSKNPTYSVMCLLPAQRSVCAQERTVTRPCALHIPVGYSDKHIYSLAILIKIYTFSIKFQETDYIKGGLMQTLLNIG